MTRYRLRAVLLLFLLLNLTACYTWQGVGTTSPAGLIEATQPDRVRVLTPGGVQVELENPSVEGDQLMGADGASLPLADVLMLETREFSIERTLLLAIAILPLGVLLGMLACGIDPSNESCMI
jgi:hypothetical protein